MPYTVAFTGHRPSKLGGFHPNLFSDRVRHILSLTIRRILTRRPNARFISGMALGVNQIAAEEVLAAGGYLIAAIPFRGQEKAWPEAS